MKPILLRHVQFLTSAVGCAAILLSRFCDAATADTGPYKILKTTQTMGSGGIDYVYADNDGRRLYIPRGDQVLVFDLDTLKDAGTIENARARGVAVDPHSHHGFCSSSPVVMWDTKTLKPIKTIEVQGRPDGILFEPAGERIWVFSHSAPNATVIDPKDGSIIATLDLGGAPEQSASDGQGKLFVTLEDKSKIAVVDVKALQVTGTYDFGGKGTGPSGLAFDVKNHVLFALCREPAVAVILNSDDGKILQTLPIGHGVDGGVFNPATMEAFSSQGDGTLTVIQEKSPTEFEVEQTVQTKSRAKTCTLDTRNNQIIVITTEPSAAGSSTGAPSPGTSGTTNKQSGADQGKKGRPGTGPGPLDIIVIGR